MSIQKRVCDEDGCRKEGTGCFVTSDCGYWEMCNENYECVKNPKKRIPQRICIEDDCSVLLNDGKCFFDTDCKNEVEVCSEDYQCVLSQKKYDEIINRYSL